MSTWKTLEWPKKHQHFIIPPVPENFSLEEYVYNIWVDGYLSDWIKFTVNLNLGLHLGTSGINFKRFNNLLLVFVCFLIFYRLQLLELVFEVSNLFLIMNQTLLCTTFKSLIVWKCFSLPADEFFLDYYLVQLMRTTKFMEHEFLFIYFMSIFAR